MTTPAFSFGRGGISFPRLRLAPRALGELAVPERYFARHSRSFWFAAAFLRGDQRERVARVYSWCRFTDDIVDLGDGSPATEAALDAWLAASRAAYEGLPSGVAVLDEVMGDMCRHAIPLAYVESLGDGVRSDLRHSRFADLASLRRYSYRVAGVVGQWLAELHGVREPWMLDRAAALGHAMQLTNILRDVGEDWDRGRLYLPIAVLQRHGLDPADIGALRRGERAIDLAYEAMLAELMDVADRDYALASEAIPFLPYGFRQAVAVASAVYRAIHDAIRRNRYDNLTRRAVVPTARKLAIAARVLWSLRSVPAVALARAT